jgi:hypothetical protein
MASDRPTARRHAQQSNEIFRALLKERVSAEQARSWSYELAQNLHNIGDNSVGEAETADEAAAERLYRQAIEAFEESRKLCDEEIENGARNDDGVIFLLANCERYLCRSYRFLARVLDDPRRSKSLLNDAVGHGNRAVSQFERLSQFKPDNFRYAWELTQTQYEIGLLCLDSQQWEAAIGYYEQTRAGLKRMARKFGGLVSRMAQIQVSLAETDHNLAMAWVSFDPVRFAAGPRRELVTEMYQICDKLTLVQQLSPNLHRVYASSCLSLAELQEEDGEKPDIELIAKAEDALKDVLAGEPTNRDVRRQLAGVRRTLADELSARGRSDEASRCRAGSLTSVQGDAQLLYELAINFAWEADAVGKWPTKLSKAQLDARRRHSADEAICMLREAVAAGFKDAARLLTQQEFALIRSSPEFREVELDLLFKTAPFAPR